MALFYILAMTTQLYMFTTVRRAVHLEGWTFLHVDLNFHSFSSEFTFHFFLNLHGLIWVPLLRSILGRWGAEKTEGYRYRRDVPHLSSPPRPLILISWSPVLLPKVLEGDSSVSNLEQRMLPALHLESSRQVKQTVLLRTPWSCPTLHHCHGSRLCALDCDSLVHVWCPHRTALPDRILAYLAHLWYDKYFQDIWMKQVLKGSSIHSWNWHPKT